MSSCRNRETVISDLPDELREKIFDCMSTLDTARSALVSTQWRDAWYRRDRLVFDQAFFESKPSSNKEGLSMTSLIYNILILRSGPLKKFTLHILRSCGSDPWIQQLDIDRWCLYLSRNGIEELHLSGPHSGPKYKIPSSLFYCKTIKQLNLEEFTFDLPVNAPRVLFPGLKSISFKGVWLRGDNKGLLCSSMPKLEKLVLFHCYATPNYKITAPELKSLTMCEYSTPGRIWLTLHLSSIKTLCIYLTWRYYYKGTTYTLDSTAFPIALNLQEIKLHGFCFDTDYHLKYVLQLLNKSPKLCVLEIEFENMIKFEKRSEVANPTLLENLIETELKMLEIVKLNRFQGSEIELCLVKLLLSNSPALHHVAIHEDLNINASLASEATKKILNFPCASPKAQILYNSRI
ncbi:unnamed protein product [Cuscuta epithymum]|uniref:F-box domain-containing protein n=1 Tax=Cuscuta epithymum TaxID=186058 RepID=A0AAV0D9Y2_9ASTE|nr:unnamed protein product [Cuscuta epithymum]